MDKDFLKISEESLSRRTRHDVPVEKLDYAYTEELPYNMV